MVSQGRPSRSRSRSSQQRFCDACNTIQNSDQSLRASSSSPLPSPPKAASPVEYDLDLGFLSSSCSSCSPPPSRNRTDASFSSRHVLFQAPSTKNSLPARLSRRYRYTPHPAMGQRQRVRDRSLGRTTEKLYRRVNNNSALHQSFFTANDFLTDESIQCRSRSNSVKPPASYRKHSFSQYGRSKSSLGSLCGKTVDKLLEMRDRDISVEYMHISSLPLSSSCREVQRDNNNIYGSVASSPNLKDITLRESTRNSSENDQRRRSKPVVKNSVNSKSISKAANNSTSAFYLGGPEHIAWNISVFGNPPPMLPFYSKNRMEVKGIFKSQLHQFHKSKGDKESEVSQGNILVHHEGFLGKNHESAELPFYLYGTEYEAWKSALTKSGRKSHQINHPQKQVKVRGMFKSFLRRFRPTTEVQEDKNDSLKNVSGDVAWGDGPMFSVYGQSAVDKGYTLNSLRQTQSPLKQRQIGRPHVARSCFATPCVARVTPIRKAKSFIETSTPMAPMTMSPKNSGPIEDNTSNAIEAATDTLSIQPNATNNNDLFRSHTLNAVIEMLVDGKPRKEHFCLTFKSRNAKPTIQMVELLVDGESVWRRKYSTDRKK